MAKKKKKKEYHLDILTGEYVWLSYEYATVGQRFGAVLLDWIMLFFLTIACFFAGIYITSKIHLSSNTVNVLFFAYIIFLYLFDFFCEYFFSGQTLGKRILKIRVISEECAPPNFMQCFIRYMLFPIDFFTWFVTMIKTQRRFGDMASGCYVVAVKDFSEEEVDIDKDFNYADPNFKVMYQCAASLNIDEFRSILKVAYTNKFIGLQGEMCKRIKKRFPDVDFLGRDDQILKQIVADFKYLESTR